jgi:serine-type D-Ala-D-Ala carboxypeptidase/endopeptidase
MNTASTHLVVASLISAFFFAGCADTPRQAEPNKPSPSASIARDFSQVNVIATEALAESKNVEGFALTIFDARDKKVFEKNYGDFSADRRVPVASASKMVAGLVILKLVDEGKLNLDTSTTASILGWTGSVGDITLRQLLSLTSGLAPGAACMSNAEMSLEACVETIRQAANPPNSPKHPAGTHFDYGGSHHHVAARMAEVASGKTWNQLFSEYFAKPLALDPMVNFYTAPWGSNFQLGTTNPRIAGGFYASINEFAPLLAITFHRGKYRQQQFIHSDLISQMGREPNPNVTIGISPMARYAKPPFRYGLTVWLECDTPATGCNSISSPGAFGFIPWIDRDHGYYAMIGMYKLAAAQETRGFDFAARLVQKLKPEINQAMGNK